MCNTSFRYSILPQVLHFVLDSKNQQIIDKANLDLSVFFVIIATALWGRIILMNSERFVGMGLAMVDEKIRGTGIVLPQKADLIAFLNEQKGGYLRRIMR